MPNNVQRCKAPPAQSIGPSDAHEVGRWINYELLRKNQSRTPIILHDRSAATNNRYLELADLALGNKKTRKKSKAAASK